MEYCLDTSVFTQAFRLYYAFDIAPAFWLAITRLAEQGVLTSPLAVYEELMPIDDELKAWARQRRSSLFVDPDSQVNTAYREIAEFVNSRYHDQHWIRDFLGGADPWVIAHAKPFELTVVTMEGEKKTEDADKVSGRLIGEIKIPNVCNHLGVKFISTFEMLRVLGVKLH